MASILDCLRKPKQFYKGEKIASSTRGLFYLLRKPIQSKPELLRKPIQIVSETVAGKTTFENFCFFQKERK